MSKAITPISRYGRLVRRIRNAGRLRQARALLKGGAFEAAELVVLDGLNRYPGDVALTAELAKLAGAKRNWSKASSRWTEVLEAYGAQAPVDVFICAASSLRKSGHLARADTVVKRGLEAYGKNALLLRELELLLRELARSALARKDWADAAQRWGELLSTKLGATSSEPVASLIRAHRNAGNIESADSILRDALSERPRDVRLLAERVLLANHRPPVDDSGFAAPRCHASEVEVVVCVHNALDVTRNCLDALAAHSSSEQLITIVDDASEPNVHTFLRTFVDQSSRRRILVNRENQGYTKSANRGLRFARADWVILLNSDAIVTEGWLCGLLECAASGSGIRAVGPLSNSAKFQSLPSSHKILEGGQIPQAGTLGPMAARVREISRRAFPKVPMLNGFCLMLHKPTLDEVGYLDEMNFPRGYGEENDLCLRLIVAGHNLAIADNVYVYHVRSASFGADVRKELVTDAVTTLKRLWQGYSYSYIHDAVQEIPALQRLRDAILA